MVVDENERKIFLEIEFESVETPKREASIMAREGISGEVAKVAQFCSVQPTAPKAPRRYNFCYYYILAFLFNLW